jgi:type I restriction-modification system DNA methylase subunit
MSTRSILTPKPKFDRPLEITDGEEIVIKIECLFPWDIDSNPGDNEIRKVLTGGNPLEEEIDIIESIMAALTVILISASLAWIRKNRKEMKEFEEMTRQRTQSKINSEKKQDEPNISEIKENEEEHNVNLDEHEYIGIEENPEIELKVEPKEPPEEEVLDDFERRLKRIRRNN